MKRFFSRFSRNYVTSLIYMLQASEYNVRDYFAWYRRVADFGHVEKRKHIEWSTKARALNIISWTYTVILLGVEIALLISLPGRDGLIGALVVAFLYGFTIPYVLALAVVVGQLVQRPIEKRRISEASAKLRAHPGLRIAIAGSYGKTTMREILKTVLAAGKKVAAPPGSYNTPLGIVSFIQNLAGDEEVLIFELGEYYPGDVKKLCEFVEPQQGIITGVNEAHLEKFGSLDKTAGTIFELADYLGNNPLYINAENPAAKDRAARGAILYSHDGVDSWHIENAKTDLSGTSFTLKNGTVSIAASSKLLGMHMIGPIAAAAHIALSLGLTVSQIEAGISNTKAFDHRLEPKTDSSGVVTLDDSYNGNPDGVRAVIDFLSGLKGRRFYVTPGLVEMGSASEAVHRDIGRQLAAASIEKVVLMRNSVTPFIEAGLTDAGYTGEVTWFDDALVAYAALPHLTVSGDIVLLQNDWPDQYA